MSSAARFDLSLSQQQHIFNFNSPQETPKRLIIHCRYLFGLGLVTLVGLMGTLTAGQVRLPHYCDHKLPTSCRLTSIGECCACYDERPHAAAYQTYIDGVGFVPRGTRWQRYCWFCKEFWENRVEASGLRPGQTRIPERPDQTEFLQRWYEFHQGFRIARRDDGTEERVAVLGEDFREVSPGFLPRTVDELRAGRERSEMEERERESNRQLQEVNEEDTQPSGPSLDETLDQMLEAATAEETQEPERDAQRSNSTAVPLEHAEITVGNVHAQSMVPAVSRNREYQARRIAALRRELQRMRSGIERVISGLRDLGENVPDHHEASQRLSALGNTLDTISPPSQEEAQQTINSVNALTGSGNSTRGDTTMADIQLRVDEARRHFEDARRNRDQAQSELDVAEQEVRSSQARLRQLQTQQRTAENYMRLFGTREEMLAQGENYESPIGGMFTRAWERFRVAEEVRREERTLQRVLDDEDMVASEDVIERLAELETRDRDVWGVPQAPRTAAEHLRNRDSPMTRLRDSRSRGGHPATVESLLQRLEEESGSEARVDLAQYGEDHDQAAPGGRDDSAGGTFGVQPQNTEGVPGLNTARAAVEAVRTERIVGGPPGQQLDEDPYANNDRGQDALFVLSVLSTNEALRNASPTPSVRIVNRLLRSVGDNSLGWADRETIESIIDNLDVVWGSGLPAERSRRRRQRGERVSFTPDAQQMATAGQIIVHDVEVMAECYQMSSAMRDVSGVSPIEKLAMLYRLQRGERNAEDRAVLFAMLQNDATFTQAQALHDDSGPEETTRLQALVNDRRQAARLGDHSRAELNSQRRATRTALAASRVAMGTSPTALLERIASRDEETRAAYQRLQENGFAPADSMTSRRLRDFLRRPVALNDFTASPSGSESGDDDGGRGLDARDSGRPEEPMTEEEMTVLLDCRICYSQKAEICTIPCGHLAMCRWCSEQHSPSHPNDHTRTRRPANCPVCRKAIRNKVRVIRS